MAGARLRGAAAGHPPGFGDHLLDLAAGPLVGVVEPLLLGLGAGDPNDLADLGPGQVPRTERGPQVRQVPERSADPEHVVRLDRLQLKLLPGVLLNRDGVVGPVPAALLHLDEQLAQLRMAGTVGRQGGEDSIVEVDSFRELGGHVGAPSGVCHVKHLGITVTCRFSAL